MKTNIYKSLLSVLLLVFTHPVLAGFSTAAGKLQSLARENRYEPGSFSDFLVVLFIFAAIYLFYKWGSRKKQ